MPGEYGLDQTNEKPLLATPASQRPIDLPLRILLGEGLALVVVALPLASAISTFTLPP